MWVQVIKCCSFIFRTSCSLCQSQRMTMIGKDKRQQELERLEKFIRETKISGYVAHLWFSSLRNKYPFQYLQLLQKHRKAITDPAKLEVNEDRIYAAECWINGMKASFTKYLLMPPEDEDQKREFDMLANRLEEWLLKQNQEN